jgi:hypothetical protein
MKLLGQDIPVRDLVIQIGDRLRIRGLPTSAPVEVPAEGVEPRVEPLTYNLNALEEHADPTRGLPLHTHRGGVGQLVLAAKWTFRKTCQVLINETLGRQRVFNGLVRDSYAQLSAEVIRLRREVEELRARGAAPAPAKPASAERAPMAATEAPATRPPPASTEGAAAKPPQSSKGAPPAKPPQSSRGASMARDASTPKGAPATRSSQPFTAKDVPASARKHAPESGAPGAGPTTSSEPVLPKPRHARQEASRPSRRESGTASGQQGGTAPVEPSAPRQRPPGAKRSGRRKGR